MLAGLVHLGGCLPATWTVVPEVRGRVVTATGQPAPGAKVVISPAETSSKTRALQVRADARGEFRQREKTRWTIVPFLPLDAYAEEFIATASHAGLESAPVQFGGGFKHPHHFGLTNKSESFDLGDLVLVQAPSGDR